MIGHKRARAKAVPASATHATMILRAGMVLMLIAALWALSASAAFARGGPVSVADLVERLSPAVVNISTRQKNAAAGKDGSQMPQLPEGTPFKEYFEEFLKRQQQQGRGGRNNRPRNASSLGSGFVIDPSGIVITNKHVIEGADEIEVIFKDGTRLKAEVKGSEKDTDLAVLMVKPEKPLPSVKWGDSSKLRIGDWVMAIGNPFGLGGSVTLGIVSAKNRVINAGRYDDFIQTDAAINRGNSGGPLFDMDGNVVGVNTAIYSPNGGSIGIGFSVPSDTARNVISQLIKFGETRRGWLGVRIQSVTEDLAESLSLSEAKGALVADVTPTSPAEKAGITPGDVIVSLDGKDMKDSRAVSRAVGSLPPDTEVRVGLLRKGKPREITIKLGLLSDGEKLAKREDAAKVTVNTKQADIPLLGLKVEELTDDLRTKFKVPEKVNGVVVSEVDAEGSAAAKQLKPGDVISEVGDVKAASPKDVAAAVKDAQSAGDTSILMLVLRAQRNFDPHFMALKLKKKE